MTETETAVLFSYERSGNTWVRYIAEVLTGRETIGAPESGTDLPMHRRIPQISVRPDLPPVALKRHGFEHFEPDDVFRPLIVLVRNYKESITRVRKQREKLGWSFNLAKECRRYVDVIRHFDAFAGEKILIYYEDLMQETAASIGRFGDFLGASSSKVSTFVDYLDMHRARSLRHYDERSGSHTRGEKLIHHSLEIDGNGRCEFDRCVQRLHPGLFEKYLKSYEESTILRAV